MTKPKNAFYAPKKAYRTGYMFWYHGIYQHTGINTECMVSFVMRINLRSMCNSKFLECPMQTPRQISKLLNRQYKTPQWKDGPEKKK